MTSPDDKEKSSTRPEDIEATDNPLLQEVQGVIELLREAQDLLEEAPTAINPLKWWDRAAALAYEGIGKFDEVVRSLDGSEDPMENLPEPFVVLFSELVSTMRNCAEQSKYYPAFQEQFDSLWEKSPEERETVLFAIWDRDTAGVSKETIRGKAMRLFSLEQPNIEDHEVFQWSAYANERDRVRQELEPHRREFLQTQFEEAYKSLETICSAPEPAWKIVAEERFNEFQHSDLKKFMFEQYFEQFEDTVHSLDIPFPQLPRLYATEDIPLDETVIHMHLSLGRSHWYVSEYSPEKRIFFGYAMLNGDTWNAEWGYTSLDELLDQNVQGLKIERDFSWEPKPFGQIELE